MLRRSVVVAALLLSACRAGGDAPATAPEGTGAPTASEAATPVAVAQPAGTSVYTLQFEIAPNSPTCTERKSVHGIEDVGLTDLRFFVSSVALLDDAGASHPAMFVPDGSFQGATTAFVDLENGTGTCVSGDAEVNTAVRVWAPEGMTVRGVSFVLGIPFADNHADPMEAAPPLDRTALHWTWQAGYKFIRAGFTSTAGPWQLHFGSGGCEGTAGNVTGCSQDNRATVSLAGELGDTITVLVDPTVMMPANLADAELPRAVRDGCMADPNDAGCTQPRTALGVDGTDAQQLVFRLP